MKRCHTMPFGAELQTDGSTRFRLWAPSAQRVELVLNPTSSSEHALPLVRDGDGWYETQQADGVGARYCYRIDGACNVPDPASRFNPDGVHAASEVIDARAYQWQDIDWRGRPWREAVIYELHVGTFTPHGNFAAMQARLDALVKTGITAIELMPVNAFAGRHGWGYDGVLPYAPHAAYGTPDELKQLVDAAHACGLMVLLDVVYNHFGPDGNYLRTYAADFFTDRYRTPWGDAINFDGANASNVRQYFIHNALYWLEEFHFDGLRVDAVHAIQDQSPKHFVDELAEAIESGPAKQRFVHLVLENHNNASRFLRGGESERLSRSQWNDDVHHALHVIATRETDGYYSDFAAMPTAQLGRCLAEGFAFQGEPSAFGGNAARGEPSRDLPPTAFVNFLQTHDQIGNRACGERIAQLADSDALRAAYAILLLAPQPPLLFMGEEYAASQPFQYFCDHAGELGAAVTAGRRREFARFAAFSSAQAREGIPDPCAQTTFDRSCLRWADRLEGVHQTWLQFIAQLLELRQRLIVPLVPHILQAATRFDLIDTSGLTVVWPLDDGRTLLLQANLSAQPLLGAVTDAASLLFSTSRPDDAAALELAPWEVRWMHTPRVL